MAHIVAKFLACLLIVGNVAALQVHQQAGIPRSKNVPSQPVLSPQIKHYSTTQNQPARHKLSTAANHTCGESGAWSEAFQECVYCSKNYTAQKDTGGAVKCYCNSPYQQFSQANGSKSCYKPCGDYGYWSFTYKSCRYCYSRHQTIQRNTAGELECYCNSPYQQITRANGSKVCQKPRSMCSYPNAWNEAQQKCAECSDPRAYATKDTAGELVCYCAQPYKLTPQANGPATCQMPSSTAVNSTCSYPDAWDQSIKKCQHCIWPHSYIKKGTGGKWYCYCIQPYQQLLKADGNYTCQMPSSTLVNHTCREFDPSDNQLCVHCTTHFTLKRSTTTGKTQCICQKPFKIIVDPSGDWYCLL